MTDTRIEYVPLPAAPEDDNAIEFDSALELWRDMPAIYAGSPPDLEVPVRVAWAGHEVMGRPGEMVAGCTIGRKSIQITGVAASPREMLERLDDELRAALSSVRSLLARTAPAEAHADDVGEDTALHVIDARGGAAPTCAACGAELAPVRADGLFEDEVEHPCGECGARNRLTVAEDDADGASYVYASTWSCKHGLNSERPCVPCGRLVDADPRIAQEHAPEAPSRG